MNLSKQSRLIAEELGWTDIKETGRLDGHMRGRKPVPILGEFHEVPVYPMDLGACEAILMDLHARGSVEIYSQQGDWQVWAQADNRDTVVVDADTVPAAICECFLRLCGKWEEAE